MNILYKSFNYFCYKNHPLVQIMYLALVIGGFCLFILKGFKEHLPNRFLSDNHFYFATFGTGFCLWSYYKVCSVSPGVITKDNIKYYQKKYHLFDGYIYVENNVCKTCNLPKYKFCDS